MDDKKKPVERVLEGKDCEWCDYAYTFNEDMQTMCTKLNMTVNNDRANKCKYYKGIFTTASQ